jgi:DNA topoisomerase IA
MVYNFTAKVENEFDDIAEGHVNGRLPLIASTKDFIQS